MRMLLVVWLLTCCFSEDSKHHKYACESDIFCKGPILDKIQRAQLFLDPKRFVDMPTKVPRDQIFESFAKLNRDASPKELHVFLDENFHRAGRDLKIVLPKDYKEDVGFLKGLKDPKLKDFGLAIHSKWKSLLRQVDKSVLCDGCESTLLDLPYPFLVPGGRFREFYYWDTFWILEGIYVSEMCLTARSVIENTLWMVKEFGFVPNGSRSYYLNRSQPPMLPKMIERYFEECGSKLKNSTKFLQRALECLEIEYKFWMENRSVTVKDLNGQDHVLNYYSAQMNTPRPESYMHDVDLAGKTSAVNSLYRNLAGAAESGWDFSGRWMHWDSESKIPGLEHTITSEIVPVDLNSIMFRNELIIERLFDKVGNNTKASFYSSAAEKRAAAIQSILFVESKNQWRDYNWVTKSPMIERPFYITDICPLWYGPWKGHDLAMTEKMLDEHEKILYDYPGGTPISEAYTNQQWDFPNVWAPTQYGLVQLHLRLWRESGKQGHFDKAVSVAQKWITSTYCGYKHYGYVFEKYNAKVVGQPGGGGEYIVQEGFGWSNGVILWLLKELGPHLKVPDHCPKLPIMSLQNPESPVQFITIMVWIICLLLSATFLTVLIIHWLGFRPVGRVNGMDEEIPFNQP